MQPKIPNMKQKLEDFSSELKVHKLEVHNQTMQEKKRNTESDIIIDKAWINLYAVILNSILSI